MRDYKFSLRKWTRERERKGITTEMLIRSSNGRQLCQTRTKPLFKDQKADLRIDLNGALQDGFRIRISPEKYRNIDELQDLADVSSSARNCLEVVRRGQVAASSKVAGYLPASMTAFSVRGPRFRRKAQLSTCSSCL